MRVIIKAVICGFLLGQSVSVPADTEAEITSHIKAGFELTSQKHDERALVEFLYAAAGAHASAGWALYRLQRFSEAASEFEKASYINPSDARYHHFLGMTYRKTGQFDLAEKAIKRELQLSPSAEAYLSLERVYVAQGREKEAVEVLEKAVKKYPFDKKLALELQTFHP